MQVSKEEVALVTLRNISIALADELSRQYSGQELHRGATFEKVVLLSQAMLLLQSRGFQIPETVERLGRMVAGAND